MSKYFQNKILGYVLAFMFIVGQVFIFNILVIPIAEAGVCTDVSFLKDGKIVKQEGSVSVPANDKSKYQIKAVIKAKTKTTCNDTYVRIGVIYIDQLDVSKPIKYLLAATKIPDAGLTKTLSFATTDAQGIYNYYIETYSIGGNDVNKPDGSVNNDGLRITLGQAGKADVGTNSGNQSPQNTDYQSQPARDYAGKDWDGTLSILNPVKFDGNEVNDISQIGSKVINWLLLIISLLATAMIIYAGILLVFNGGNESQFKKAKTTLTWAIVGLVVALSAFAIVNIIQSLL